MENRQTKYVLYSVIIATLIFEFFLFKTYLYNNIIGFYPATFDQAVYLPNTYEYFEHLKKEGIQSLLLLFSNLPTGVLFPVNALIMFSIFEPSRFFALLPNFLYFIALQIILYWTVKSVTKSRTLGFLSFILLLSLNTPFLDAGGLWDFRMDFIAFCMYGIVISFVIKSNVFVDKKWSLIVALTASLMILMRFITIVYFCSILGILFCYYLKQYYFGSLSEEKITSKLRIQNILRAGSIIFLIILPFILINQHALYDYYIKGHFTDKEHIYRGLANTNWMDYLLYYPRMIREFHFGIITSYVFIFLFFILPPLSLMVNWKNLMEKNFLWKNEFIFLFCSIAIPIIILTLDPSKSHIVANILMTPMIWLSLLISSYFGLGTFLKKTNFILIILFIFALAFQWQSCITHHIKKERVSELTNLSNMLIDIGNYASNRGLTKFVFSHDQNSEFLNHGTLKTIYYEKQRKLLEVNGSLLGASILPISKEEAFEALKKSDVVVLTLSKYPAGNFPFSQSMLSLHPFLIDYAEHHYKKIGDYSYMGTLYRVYGNELIRL